MPPPECAYHPQKKCEADRQQSGQQHHKVVVEKERYGEVRFDASVLRILFSRRESRLDLLDALDRSASLDVPVRNGGL